MEKLYHINEQQVAEIDERYDEIWKFDEPIKNLEILLAKTVSSAALLKKKELIKATKEKIRRLKAESESKQDLIMQEESETFIFSDLYHDRRIGVSKTKIDAVNESINLVGLWLPKIAWTQIMNLL